jgi:hypothetical protein
MNKAVAPKRASRGKWITFALLAALAAFLYAAIIIKLKRYGL